MGRRQVDADLVIDAGGRAGRLTRALRGPVERGDCGIAYVLRQYQLLPGAPDGPVNAPFGVVEIYFRLPVGRVRPRQPDPVRLDYPGSTDRQLAALRSQAAFEAAA